MPGQLAGNDHGHGGTGMPQGPTNYKNRPSDGGDQGSMERAAASTGRPMISIAVGDLSKDAGGGGAVAAFRNAEGGISTRFYSLQVTRGDVPACVLLPEPEQSTRQVPTITIKVGY